MSDEKVTEIKGSGSNPIQSAANKLLEALGKDSQKKIEDQVKKTVDALKIASKEKQVLQDLLTEADSEKLTLKDLIGELN